MWQEAKANDKRIKELMVDHRKRAERRRAYYESRLGDPQQLIRVIGVSSKVYPDAEQFYYHENPDNLQYAMASFDGRSLLDFVPETSTRRGFSDVTKEEREMADELNFERYHDLIEAERLNVSEADRLAEVDEEWTKLLDRHQAKLALLNTKEKGSSSKGRTFGFDYGTSKMKEEDLDDDTEQESQLLKDILFIDINPVRHIHVDILQYVDELTDKDKQVLNEMSGKYGIRSYARLLRVAKKDRDDELRALKRQQDDGRSKDNNNTGKRSANERRRLRRRGDRNAGPRHEDRYRRRYSPTYEPYRRSSASDDSSGEEMPRPEDSDCVVIEFGSTAPEETKMDLDKEISNENQRSSMTITPVEKKLTPMEKLKLKMRAGLQKQIVSDEKEKRQKEKEKELENLRELARNQGLPINAYMRPEPPMREKSDNQDSAGKSRYRSPSSSRSPSPIARHTSPIRKRSPSRERTRRSPSRERTRRSPSRERTRRSPSRERTRRSPSRDRTKRSDSRERSKRSYSRERTRKTSRERSRRTSRRSTSRERSRRNKDYRERSPQAKRRYRSPSSEKRDSKRR
ncbi:uncharacterized protein EV154DRAFT_476718 [Mucor mucedo]|uniref:uncharacterized protein n=1 Tax=Mucor mucedo TaxID=29922 RepID=UPI00221EE7A4|nr:uncharacterized protein EV154DRAFT_476718 [Mucor mucedo]KAI7895992.1 hypothetical protein EV154DRAFT_476718 [Mucor mucedo]